MTTPASRHPTSQVCSSQSLPPCSESESSFLISISKPNSATDILAKATESIFETSLGELSPVGTFEADFTSKETDATISSFTQNDLPVVDSPPPCGEQFNNSQNAKNSSVLGEVIPPLCSTPTPTNLQNVVTAPADASPDILADLVDNVYCSPVKSINDVPGIASENSLQRQNSASNHLSSSLVESQSISVLPIERRIGDKCSDIRKNDMNSVNSPPVKKAKLIDESQSNKNEGVENVTRQISTSCDFSKSVEVERTRTEQAMKDISNVLLDPCDGQGSSTSTPTNFLSITQLASTAITSTTTTSYSPAITASVAFTIDTSMSNESSPFSSISPLLASPSKSAELSFQGLRNSISQQQTFPNTMTLHQNQGKGISQTQCSGSSISHQQNLVTDVSQQIVNETNNALQTSLRPSNSQQTGLETSNSHQAGLGTHNSQQTGLGTNMHQQPSMGPIVFQSSISVISFKSY